MSRPIISKDRKSALIVGYESHVGQKVLSLLAEHPAYERVKVLAHQRTRDRLTGVDYHFAPLEKALETELDCDDAFICYDGSHYNLSGAHYLEKENFKYIPRLAHHVHLAGANQLMFLSSKNADRDSLFFGNRIRGLIEEAIAKIDFWSLHIFRPNIILEEDSSSWGKSIADTMGKTVDKYTGDWLKKNKPIEASTIAAAMVELAQHTKEGKFTIRGSWLQDFNPDDPTTALTKI